MKLRKNIFIYLIFFFLLSELSGQSIINNNLPLLPLKSGNSVLFGKDIIIHDQPDQDQRNIAICSAFNGWLYTVYSYFDDINNFPAFTLMRSIDSGISWTVLFDGPYPAEDNKFKSIDIVTIGDSISNLKVIFAGLITDGSFDMGESFIYRFNGETGEFEDGLFDELLISNISLATDYNYPANNSNPSTLGALYSKYSNIKDSIIFRSSSNGGMSLDGRQVVAVTGNRFHKVALAYGRSASWSSGRYFAAWEEQAAFDSITGHIFTAHTNPNYNSPFTTPVNLDSLDASNTNKIRNPAIACQYNNVDNDSSNLTEVVLFEKYNPTNQRSDLRGYYNLQAANHSKFNKLNISDSLHNNLQPDISFNPYDSTFMVTYYDSTIQKLPFIINNYNLRNPSTWNVVSPGYNDSSNLSAPYPKVEITSDLQTGANVWIGERSGGNGIAMFDAPSSTYTGISGNKKTDNNGLIGVYPNPSNGNATIRFNMQNEGDVRIVIYDVMGKEVKSIIEPSMSPGNHTISFSTSELPSGLYYYRLIANDQVEPGKFIRQ